MGTPDSGRPGTLGSGGTLGAGSGTGLLGREGRDGTAPWHTLTPAGDADTDTELPPPDSETVPLPVPGKGTLVGRPGVDWQVSAAVFVVDLVADFELDVCAAFGTDGVLGGAGSPVVGAAGGVAHTFRPFVELADTETEPPPPEALKPPLPDPGIWAGDAGGANVWQEAPVPPPEGSEGGVAQTVRAFVELADSETAPPPPDALKPPLPEPGNATGDAGGAKVWQEAPVPPPEGAEGGVAQTVRPFVELAEMEAEPPPPETLPPPLPDPGNAAGVDGAAKCWQDALDALSAESDGVAAPNAWPKWLAGKTMAPTTAPTVAALTAIAAMPAPRPRRCLRLFSGSPCGGPCSSWSSS